MRTLLSFLGVLVLFSWVNSADAAQRERLPQKRELFAAIKAGEVAVELIPKDATRLTLKIENHTEKPLLLRIPESFVGVPVLAQQPGNFFGNGNGNGNGNFGNGFGNGNNQQGGGNQAVGGNRNGGNQGRGNGLGQGNGFFHVEPKRVLKLKFPCACLDYGKADPRPRIPYRLVALADYRSSKDLAAVMKQWSLSHTPQRIVQLAIWHATNGVRWEELASLQYKHANGRTSPQYSAVAIQQARDFYDRAMKQKQSSQTAARR